MISTAETPFTHMMTHMTVGGGIAFAVLVIAIAWIATTLIKSFFE